MSVIVEEVQGSRQIQLTAETAKARMDLIGARQAIEAGNYRAAILCLKWAMESVLPQEQRYCSQTLPDSDSDKTLQGFLDNIVEAIRNRSEFDRQLTAKEREGLNAMPYSVARAFRK